MKHTHTTLACMAAFAFAYPVSAWASAGGSCHFHGNKPAVEATVLGCATGKALKSGKEDKCVRHTTTALVLGKPQWPGNPQVGV